MRYENKMMKEFLLKNGIKATPKYIYYGSLRGTWRLWNYSIPWTVKIAETLNSLGFLGYNGKPLTEHSGNGGTFCTFLRGHNEMLLKIK